MRVTAQVKGLKEVQKAFEKSGEAVKDLKRAHKRLGAQVLIWSRPRMPRRSGAFQNSWKPQQIKSGVAVVSKLPYAGMLEVGGVSFWKPRNGRYARVPIGNEIRTMRKHFIWKKEQAPHDSWYIIPAVMDHTAELEHLYQEELAAIFAKHGL